MPDILASVPEKDRCPQNPPNGGHMMRVGPMSDGVAACAYCGVKQSAEAALEVIAFNLATGSALVEPKQVKAELKRMRTEILNEAIEAARGEYLHDDTRTPEDEAYNQAVSDVVAAIGALLEGGAA